MEISIIIVSWKVKELLEKCLASIRKYKGNVSLEIIVVDNNSQDGSVEMIRNEYPEVKLIANKCNNGFGKANNQAIKIAKGRYLLLLNPDTEITDKTVVKISDFMKNRPKAGIVGGKIINTDGTLQLSVRKFPDIASQAMILLKLHNFFKKAKPLIKYYLPYFDYNKEAEVDQVMGAFMIIQRECLYDIGLFDEKFWLWFEEIDLCKRAKEKGWQVVYAPQFEIMHHKGKSFGKLKAIKEQMILNKSMLYYFKKHNSMAKYLVLVILWPISVFLAAIVQILESLSINLKPKKAM